MKLAHLSTRALFAVVLGIGLAFILAEFCSRGLYEIYSTSTFFRRHTGNSPNAFAEGLQKVSWALIFCSSWWMLWRFDLFFTRTSNGLSDSKEDFNQNFSSDDSKKEDETFKPEEDEKNQKNNDDNDSAQTSYSKTEENPKSHDSSSPLKPDEQDEKFLQVLKISMDSPRDFDSIKAVYRKKIAQYHPDKVSAMGPEIKEVAEQKAKEINEAYEHFRKKFSS